MRIIIICGDDECGQEYPADTKDRIWECPHCGRSRENQYYPFLTAVLMNARIHAADADWRTLHDDLLATAQGKVADLLDRMTYLRRDVEKLRLQLPEEDRKGLADLPSPDDLPDFLGGWSPVATTDDDRWRDLHDQLLEGARGDILALEDAVGGMESEIRDIKSKLDLA
jgi:hypothetical protein